jgi:predicted DNA-binding transcriptional regulator AlpA
MSVVVDVVAEEVLPIKRIARSLNLDVATIGRMSARGDFPPPLRLGTRKRMYLRSAVEAWWHTVLGGQNGTPFPLAPEHADDDQ